jgi:flagellar protein FliO/FliZ
MEFWDSFIRMMSALTVVLGLMMGLAWTARRFGAARLTGPAGRGVVQVLGCGTIGPKKQIALVAVAGELLIIGSTETDLVPLGRVTDSEQVRKLLGNAEQ